jgi:hypothetical protein
MDVRLDRRCWICGAVADSAEHRIKKKDLIRAYGKGPYNRSTGPLHVRGGKLTPIQGPSSKRIKYAAALCHRCNTTATQPYDKAYDRFISWVFENEELVLRRRLINFADVYGLKFEVSQLDLFKYCVKSFGSRLIDAGAKVPADLVELLPLKRFRTALRVTFSVNEDVLLMDESHRSGFIGKGMLAGYESKSNEGIPITYKWNEHVSWLTTHYWYGMRPVSGLGSVWIADAQHVYLGTSAPLSPKERADVLARVGKDGSDDR